MGVKKNKKLKLKVKDHLNTEVKFFNEKFQEIMQELKNVLLIYKPGNIFPSMQEDENYLSGVIEISLAFRFLESQDSKNFKLSEKTEIGKIFDFIFKSDFIFLNEDLVLQNKEKNRNRYKKLKYFK